MFDIQVYSSRRQGLLAKGLSGLALFLGNSESPKNYADNTYRFRQDSSFLYYFGLSHPGLAAVLDFDTGGQIIYGDELTIDQIVWTGSQPSLTERAGRCGVTDVRPFAQLADDLRQATDKRRQVHFLPPYRAENRILLFELLGVAPNTQSERASLALIQAVINQRNYKSAEEVAEIEKAVNTTVRMHQAAMRMARSGMLEAEIAAEVERIALAEDGTLSFPVIATVNGQTLHNHDHSNRLQEGGLFLLDAGAESKMGYAGDMSSTFPIARTFTPRQKEIYQIALNGHEKAISMLRPGIAFKEIYFETAREMMRGLKDLGFVRGDVHEMVAVGAHAMFFPCGLGHMMGLDVHDMEDLGEQYVGYDGESKSNQFGLKSLRLARKLEPGFVLTIEPGVYFIPELIDLWRKENRFAEFLDYARIDRYRDFGGCRNEEDFLITEDGCRLLGRPLAKTVKEVEEERQSGAF